MCVGVNSTPFTCPPVIDWAHAVYSRHCKVRDTVPDSTVRVPTCPLYCLYSGLPGDGFTSSI